MNELVTIRTEKAPRVKQITVISGKGGTGKTSLVGSFAALSQNVVLADCDVDAADLHLLTEPRVIHRESFTGGKAHGSRRTSVRHAANAKSFAGLTRSTAMPRTTASPKRYFASIRWRARAAVYAPGFVPRELSSFFPR